MAWRLSMGLRNAILGSDSYVSAFTNAVMEIRTGVQPADADTAETGVLLCRVTLDSLAFVPGQPGNGLNFGQVAEGLMKKAAGEVWSGQNVADGTAGWFRIYANDMTTGSSITAVRLDGACATSGAQMNLTSTTLINGVTTTIDDVSIPMPASS